MKTYTKTGIQHFFKIQKVNHQKKLPHTLMGRTEIWEGQKFRKVKCGNYLAICLRKRCELYCKYQKQQGKETKMRPGVNIMAH